jgi:hypothetical protein
MREFTLMLYPVTLCIYLFVVLDLHSMGSARFVPLCAAQSTEACGLRKCQPVIAMHSVPEIRCLRNPVRTAVQKSLLSVGYYGLRRMPVKPHFQNYLNSGLNQYSLSMALPMNLCSILHSVDPTLELCIVWATLGFFDSLFVQTRQEARILIKLKQGSVSAVGITKPRVRWHEVSTKI